MALVLRRVPDKARIAKNAKLAKQRLRSWRSFLRWIDNHSNSSWVFRGLGDKSFTLLPTVGRKQPFRTVDERTIFEIFRKRFREYVADPDLNELDILALAQHHGLPTRLLDWTTNPLVAAYFAVSSPPGTVTARKVLPSGNVSTLKATYTPKDSTVDARIVAYRVPSRLILEPKESPFAVTDVKFITPRSLTSRIVNQSGVFSVHEKPSEAWDVPLLSTDDIFDIPAGTRDFFRRRLYYLGVEPQRIMGGLDGLGERLAWQYRSSIGLGAVK